MPEVISILDVTDYDAAIAARVDLLRSGGIVVLPTETVYGSAGLLSQPQAKLRLRRMRPSSSEKPFTIHLASRNDAMRFIGRVSDLGQRMMRKLWPGPVALVFDVPAERRAEVAVELRVDERDLYNGAQITLRCPDHIVATDILRQVDGPVALTLVESSDWSNLEADLVFDAGPSTYSKPSTIVHVLDDRYEIVREGVYDQRIIQRLLRTTILFVCSGNTCRSPIAEALARRKIAEKLGMTQDDLEKKGDYGPVGWELCDARARATPQAVDAVKELGADLTRHRSRPLSVELIHQADRIFTMGRSHVAAVAALVPSATEKTSTLSPEGDIEDPIGGDLSLYQSLARQLEALIDTQVVEKVIR